MPYSPAYLSRQAVGAAEHLALMAQERQPPPQPPLPLEPGSSSSGGGGGSGGGGAVRLSTEGAASAVAAPAARAALAEPSARAVATAAASTAAAAAVQPTGGVFAHETQPFPPSPSARQRGQAAPLCRATARPLRPPRAHLAALSSSWHSHGEAQPLRVQPRPRVPEQAAAIGAHSTAFGCAGVRMAGQLASPSPVGRPSSLGCLGAARR